VIRTAVRLQPDWLLSELGDSIAVRTSYLWNQEAERVDQLEGLYLGAVALDESRGRAAPGPEASLVLSREALSLGLARVDPESRLLSLGARLALLSRHCPEELAELSPEQATVCRELAGQEPGPLELSLRLSSEGVTSLKELTQLHLAEALLARFPQSFRSRLDRLFPATVQLGGGLVVPIHYEPGRPPHIEARLQNFFSMSSTPVIAQGRLPLTLHLLAPNHRPVQVTTDLPGFWERHYPALRKELMRKYPKHLWPEDGLRAAPPTPGRIR